jgi:hypothetical protein
MRVSLLHDYCLDVLFQTLPLAIVYQTVHHDAQLHTHKLVPPPDDAN